MQSFRVFDLDGTVICSNHRKATLPDGSLDLVHWIENNTPDKIARDSLLPLIDLMRVQFDKGHRIVICTARVLGDADYEFFMMNFVPFHDVLSRPMGCTMGDAELKDIQLRLYAQAQGISWAKFCALSKVYDDNLGVLDRLGSIGMDCKNAVNINKALTGMAMLKHG